MKALIFDCDGVLVDTERDGHRVAFNRAFSEKRLGVEWSIELYGELLAISGGKERMRHFFDKKGWPEAAGSGDEAHDAFILEMHRLKTDIFMRIIGEGSLPLRPGVARLVDEAIAAGTKLAVCSTSNERAVNLIVDTMLGSERRKSFSAILAGDVVSKKKPDPEIYKLAEKTLKVEPAECVVVEDSRNGLLAAKAAGMRCIITKSGYTGGEDFTEADAVYLELGDEPGPVVRLADLAAL
jgi:HAD superfamily hydrolase (TIGR01509 family)